MWKLVKMKKIISLLLLAILVIGFGFILYKNKIGGDTNTIANNLQITSGNVAREVPIEVSPGNFEIKYIIKPSPTLKMAAIEDYVSGDCTFADGSNVYRLFTFNSDEKTVKVIATSSGKCIFSGQYGYADKPDTNIKVLMSQTVNVK